MPVFRRIRIVRFRAGSVGLPPVADVTGDPYPQEVYYTAAGVAKLLGLTNWEVAYQSQGATVEPWLGPTLDQTFVRASAQNRS